MDKKKDIALNKYYMGVAYEELKQYAKALDIFNGLIKLDHKFINAYYHIGIYTAN